MEQKKDSIHNILAHSYLSYFVFSIIGLFADVLLGFSVQIQNAENIATICLVVGSLLIIWAQNTSKKSFKGSDQNRGPYFKYGPYRYMRNPTHLGLVVMVAGYTLVSGSIIFLAITILGYMISNVFFKKYESVLKDNYGQEYDDYKKKVPKIF